MLVKMCLNETYSKVWTGKLSFVKNSKIGLSRTIIVSFFFVGMELGLSHLGSYVGKDVKKWDTM